MTVYMSKSIIPKVICVHIKISYIYGAAVYMSKSVMPIMVLYVHVKINYAYNGAVFTCQDQLCL